MVFRYGKKRGRAVAGLSALFLFASLSAQENATGKAPDQVELRRQLMADLAKASADQEKAYLDQLTKLERQAAAAGDYEGAEAFAKERERSKSKSEEAAKAAEPKPLEIAKPTPDTTLEKEDEAPTVKDIMLRTSAATLSGSVTLDTRGNLSSWSADSSATWTLPALPPGGYEVVVLFDGIAGNHAVRVKEDFYYLDGRIEASDPAVETGAKIGTLRVRSGAGTFSVRFPSLPDGSLLRVRGIELVSTLR